MNVELIKADLNNTDHQQHILELTNAYALDPMGGGKPLSDEVRKNLISGLQETPHALILLAFLDGKAVGIANCFWGFSTFYAKKLIYIHDLAVLPEARGNGVGKALISHLKEIAREADCCKLTLEVLEHNPARRLYEREGFKLGEPPFYYMSYVL